MTRLPDGERIATLEAEVANLRGDLKEIKDILAGVLKTLNEMSGGKKAVMGMCGLIGSAIGVLAALFGMHVFGK